MLIFLCSVEWIPSGSCLHNSLLTFRIWRRSVGNPSTSQSTVSQCCVRDTTQDRMQLHVRFDPHLTSAGRSRHLAPVLLSHRMASNIFRGSAGGRPVTSGSGKTSWMKSRCSSVRLCRIALTSLPNDAEEVEALEIIKLTARVLYKPNVMRKKRT